MLYSACQHVINLDVKSNIVIDGVVFVCDYTNSHTRNSDCDGISAGGSMIQIRNTTIRMGRYGLGGAVPPPSNLIHDFYRRACPLWLPHSASAASADSLSSTISAGSSRGDMIWSRRTVLANNISVASISLTLFYRGGSVHRCARLTISRITLSSLT